MRTILHLTTIVKADHRKAGKTLNFRLGIKDGILCYSLHGQDTRHVISSCGPLGQTGDVSTWHNVGSKSLVSNLMFDYVDGIDRDTRRVWIATCRHVAMKYGFEL